MKNLNEDQPKDEELDAIFNESEESSDEVQASSAEPEEGVANESVEAQPETIEASEEVGEEAVEQNTPTELESLRTDYEKLQHKYRSDDGRIAALQRQVSELQKVNNTLSRSVDARASTPKGKPDINPEQIVEDLYSGDEKRAKTAVETLISKSSGGSRQEVEEAVRRQVQPLRDAEHNRLKASEEQALEKAYPDWRQTVNTNEFKQWFSNRPKSIQKLAESDYSSDAIDLLDYYTSTTATPQSAKAEPSKVDQIKAKREKQLASGTGISSKGGSGASGGEPTDPDALFNYLERNDPDYNTALRR